VKKRREKETSNALGLMEEVSKSQRDSPSSLVGSYGEERLRRENRKEIRVQRKRKGRG